MEEKNSKTSRFGVLSMMVLVLWMMVMISPTVACPGEGSGSACRDCIADRMKYSCPSCVPILQCMAKCLWGGTSRTQCTKRCDCGNGGKPTLSDCKKCMSRCKCSCVA